LLLSLTCSGEILHLLPRAQSRICTQWQKADSQQKKQRSFSRFRKEAAVEELILEEVLVLSM